MMLIQPLVQHICFKGRRYRLNLSYDNVLRVFEVQREPLFNPAQCVQLAVELLAGRRAGRLPLDQLSELLKAINAEFISPDVKPSKPGEPRVLDWLQDAALIYAAFRQAYGIDLIKQRGRLDWRCFYALVQGLPDDTRLRAVMGIRGRDIPEQNAHNAAQIQELMEAKAYYAIKVSDEEAQESFQAGIDRMAVALIGRAKKRGV